MFGGAQSRTHTKRPLESLSCDELCQLFSRTKFGSSATVLQGLREAQMTGRLFSQCSEEDMMNFGVKPRHRSDAMLMKRLWQRDGASVRVVEPVVTKVLRCQQLEDLDTKFTKCGNLDDASAEHQTSFLAVVPSMASCDLCVRQIGDDYKPEWDPDSDCDGHSAGVRAKWLVDQWCLSQGAARERVMTVEFPHVFAANSRRRGCVHESQSQKFAGEPSMSHIASSIHQRKVFVSPRNGASSIIPRALVSDEAALYPSRSDAETNTIEEKNLGLKRETSSFRPDGTSDDEDEYVDVLYPVYRSRDDDGHEWELVEA